MQKKTGPQGPSQRQRKVAEEIRHLLASSLSRDDFYGSVLAQVTVTLTRVDASPDLKQAKVFFTLLGGGDNAQVLAALKEKAPYFRTLVAKSLSIKYVPKIIFALDETLQKSLALEALFHSEKVAQDLGPVSPENE
ncbi:MAG: 30S ribosome-binding factor RbfA [Candidatus Puniceispirillum sp.]|nr:30S ribosome-binding factor RbfA [Candidatus Puniceispirillum sp.]